MPIEAFVVYRGGALLPADAVQAEILCEAAREGVEYEVRLVRKRNPRFHRKFMALVRFCWSLWSPPARTYKGHELERDFGGFRGDLQVLAGHFEATYRIDGQIRLRPKSISFAKCDETDFERVFSGVLNVALRHIPAMAGMTRQQVDLAVQQVMGFDS